MITIDNHKDTENYGVKIYIVGKRNRKSFRRASHIARTIFVGKQKLALYVVVAGCSWQCCTISRIDFISRRTNREMYSIIFLFFIL